MDFFSKIFNNNIDRSNHYIPIDHEANASLVSQPTVAEQGYQRQGSFLGHQVEVSFPQGDQTADRPQLRQPQRSSFTSGMIDIFEVPVNDVTENRNPEARAIKNDITFQTQKKLFAEKKRHRLEAERVAEKTRDSLLNAIETHRQAEEELATAQENLEKASNKVLEETVEENPKNQSRLSWAFSQAEENPVQKESEARIEKVKAEVKFSKSEKEVKVLADSFEEKKKTAKDSLEAEVNIARTIIKTASHKEKIFMAHWAKLVTHAKESLQITKSSRPYEKPLILKKSFPSNTTSSPAEKTSLLNASL